MAHRGMGFWHDLDLSEAVLDHFSFEGSVKAKLIAANLVGFLEVPHVGDRDLDGAALNDVNLTGVGPGV